MKWEDEERAERLMPEKRVGMRQFSQHKGVISTAP